MKLKDLPVILLDAQTTGMRPSSGQLLEIAWSVSRAEDPEPSVRSYLLTLPDGQTLPPRISEITGITQDDLIGAVSFGEVAGALDRAIKGVGSPAIILIHYAQFEKPFLVDLFSRVGAALPTYEVVCTHGLTKKLFPNLPSMNIRGTAGYFGNPVGQLKRAKEHVRATLDIWRGLVQELEKSEIHDWPALSEFLAQKSKTSKGRYVYRLPSEKRLALPDAPGIYRMIAKSGEVLYVGKATSLKSRVNSYFRGKAGRDRRKLEMMAQVWDLNVTECRSALEAALLEADEIKKFNPPYNVVMKKGRRQLVFYARDFSSSSRTQDAAHPLGPYRGMNWIEHLRLLAQSLRSESFAQIFFDPLPADQLARAFQLFCVKHGLDPQRAFTVRELLAWGLNFYRNTDEEPAREESHSEEELEELTDEAVAGKYERLLRRAGHEHWRARLMTKLLNARVTYHNAGQSCVLDFRNGSAHVDSSEKRPWHDLGVETFDRMSVLLSELEKYEHHIEWTAEGG